LGVAEQTVETQAAPTIGVFAPKGVPLHSKAREPIRTSLALGSYVMLAPVLVDNMYTDD
jgi:hypothetical protein